MLSRRTAAVCGDPGKFVLPEAPDELCDCPSVWEFLAAAAWPDTKTARKLGTLKVWAEGDRLKAMLSDHAQRLMLFTTLNPKLPLFAQLEQILMDPEGDWRPMKDWGAAGKGR